MQMLVCGISACYFIVFTTVDIAILQIPLDNDFIEPLVTFYQEFAVRVILPELLGKYFSVGRYLKEKELQKALELPSSMKNNDCEEVFIELLDGIERTQSRNVENTHLENRNEIVNRDKQIQMVTSPETYAGPCICGNGKKDDQIIHCSESTCDVHIYHRSCLLSQGKKRFNKDWKCDSCKLARKKTIKRQPLKPINIC